MFVILIKICANVYFISNTKQIFCKKNEVLPPFILPGERKSNKKYILLALQSMQPWASNLRSLLLKIGALVLLYMLCRLLFFAFHHAHFSDLGFADLLYILFFSIRFDLSVIVLSNCLFLLLYLMPFPFRELSWYRKVLKGLFILVNALAMVANCVDLAYYSFTLKRSTADILDFFGGEIGNDATRLLPLFITDYWYIVLIGLVLIWLVARLYKQTEKQLPIQWNTREIIRQFFIMCTMIVLFVILYRGGFQLKPISVPDAAMYASGKNVPLVVSTPFSILKTLDVSEIEPVTYFNTEDEILKLYNPVHPGKKGPMKKINVMVIALESFSKEYVGVLNGSKETYTPFLDSLIGEGYCFNNAFANGKKSIEGIPAIVAGLPTWMNQPYSSSPYGSNEISSIAGSLKQEGYYTAFFHGGTNGTMGFDAFARLAGFENYFGRIEYNNDKDYDGNWGIWDEEFMQYTARTISEKPQPFFATLFTLTSHHPFPVPDRYKGKFKEGSLPIHRSIGYSDFALRRFFDTAKKMPWYNNTLFVLVADHTGTSADPFYVNQVGNNAIPLLYFMPSDSTLKGSNPIVTSQVDIFPSLMDYLNYPNEYFAFGTSAFDSTAHHFALSYYDHYDYTEGNYFLYFDGEQTLGLYNYMTDSLLGTDLREQEKDIKLAMENRLKAIIQTYQQRLIKNKTH